MKQRFLITTDSELLKLLDVYFKLTGMSSRNKWFSYIVHDFLQKNKSDIESTCDVELNKVITNVL